MGEHNETLVERLKALKEKSGMTSFQIAEKAKVPESTVTRIFSGKTPNPTIITVIAMTKAMGGTAADIFDDNAQVNGQTAVVINDAEKRHDEVVSLYREIINEKTKWIRVLAIACASLVVIIAFLLVFDLMNGSIGYIRY